MYVYPYPPRSPAQKRVFNIIHGAILNRIHAHPELQIRKQLRVSIAKRAAGTLTAQWPEVLATNASPVKSDEAAVKPRRGRTVPCGPTRRRALASGRTPLRRLWNEITRDMTTLREAGQLTQYETLKNVLRLIDKIERS